MTIARTPVTTPDTTTKRNRQNKARCCRSRLPGVAPQRSVDDLRVRRATAPTLFEASFPLGRLTMRLQRVCLSAGLICSLAIGCVVSCDWATGTPALGWQIVPAGKSSYLVATRYYQRSRTERFFERSATAKQNLCPTPHSGVCRAPKPPANGKPPIPMRSTGGGSRQR